MRTFIKPLSVLLLLVCVTLVTKSAEAAAPEKVKVLLVTGFDVKSHVWEESTRMVQGILQENGRFEASISTDKEVFGTHLEKGCQVSAGRSVGFVECRNLQLIDATGRRRGKSD